MPESAKSLALIVDDPDAPMGLWIHWVVWNIDPKLSRIETSDPLHGAVQGTNTNGNTSYGGPCPPSGTHRYFFKLYALDEVLSLPSTTTADALLRAMEGHIVDSAELMGLYQRIEQAVELV